MLSVYFYDYSFTVRLDCKHFLIKYRCYTSEYELMDQKVSCYVLIKI